MLRNIRLLALCVLILLPAMLTARNTYMVDSYVDENGEIIKVYNYAGFPPEKLPPVNTDPAPKKAAPGEKGVFYLDNVPSYTWSYGCTATASGIIAAYYDSFGAPTVYTGPENGGVAPMTNTAWQTASQPDTDQLPLAASKQGVDGRTSKGHGDDYWTGYLDEATDPYYGAWTEHDHNAGQPCTADFMGTNQWYNWENADGSTSIWSSASGVFDYTGSEGATPALRDGVHGLRLFYESLGFSVDRNFTRTITGYDDPDDDPDMGPATGGYEFSMYKESVDAGRPVIIQIEGHSMVGFGYDDTTTPETLYLRDTWDTQTSPTAHSMQWGGAYSNMTHYAISEVVLGTENYFAPPENVFALNNNREVTLTWDDPSKGTKTMSYKIFRDDFVNPLATGVVGTSYVDNTAADGVHTYKVIATYVDEDPDFDSYLSLGSSVYVSPSVTSFYDDFESGDGQWLFNPTTSWWGLDTQYAYSGTYSLSDSPGGNYADNSDQLATGGAIAEVAPGLNFSAAADANATFWLRYMIEESFDYLHFQACDDGITWETLKTWSSEADNTWNQETISLGLFAGNPNVRFRFIMVTDPGYNTEGTNIDEFSIDPSEIDGAAPYVYYTKAVDYYSPQSDGFEITAKITDFTGVDYANVLYKVNSGTEQTAPSPTVSGDTYSWKLPVQTPGDMIEFRFDVQDTYTPANQGYKGPFYYVEGLHQKYDYSTVSYYTTVVTTTAQYDQKSYAVKFSSFYDDIVGAVVRGYIDQSLVDAGTTNQPMLINVWADDGSGLPGATLITPFSYTNPATLQNTNKWGYVDLKSYTALDSMVGDYFIGFECEAGGSGITHTTMTQTGEAAEFDFGRAYINYYLTNGADLTWEQSVGYNHHIRAITTDYGIVPGVLDPSPSGLAETLAPDATYSNTLNVGNSGGFSLNYNATIEYLAKKNSKAIVYSNNFNSGLLWASSGDFQWQAAATYDGGNLDGSQMGYAAAPTGNGQPKTYHGYLTSPVIDLSATTSSAYIEWDQKITGGTPTLEVSTDGNNWTTLYTGNVTGAWGSPNHQKIDLVNSWWTATTQFRFHLADGRTGNYWAVDNIVVDATSTPPWLTIDGAQTTSGTVAPAGSDPVSVGWDATGLTDGIYNAIIHLTSENSSENVTVQMTVANVTPPATPTLVYPSDTATLSDLTPDLDWNDSADASSYTVVVDNNSDFGTPEINQTVSVSNYTPTTALAEGTYYWKVLASNSGGDSGYSSTWTFTLASPDITVDQTAVAGVADLTATLTDSDVFNIGNIGNYVLDYSASFEYVVAKDAKADVTLASNNFDAGIGWTPSGAITWAQKTDTSNLDGTAFANIDADPVADPNGSLDGYLTSGVFDGTAAYSIVVDFDQVSSLTTSSCNVEYTLDGTNWTSIYNNTASTGAWGTPDHQKIEIPEKSTTMQVRFLGTMKNQSGSYWAIDNVVVTGLDPANYGWLTLNGVTSTINGTVAVSGSDAITVGYDATGMSAGTYNALITINSTDPDEPVKTVDVQFVVSGGTVIPAVPANVVTSISGTDLVIDWDVSADAEGYDVYSSADPYGTFTFEASVPTNQYIVPVSLAKNFYYIVATNTTKVGSAKKKTIKDIKEERTDR